MSDVEGHEHLPVDPPPPEGSTELTAYREHEVSARESLRKERGEALEKQSRATAWLMLFGFGPATLAAIVLALVFGRPDLIAAFVGLGAGVQLWRIWKQRRKVKEIEKELEDPIDGS